jgi:hypothetical protein
MQTASQAAREELGELPPAPAQKAPQGEWESAALRAGSVLVQGRGLQGRQHLLEFAPYGLDLPAVSRRRGTGPAAQPCKRPRPPAAAGVAARQEVGGEAAAEQGGDRVPRHTGTGAPEAR